MTEYAPLGMIEQLPELKVSYRGKNSAGGRRAIFKSAGVGPLPARWMRGIGSGSEVRVRLIVKLEGQLVLLPDPLI